MLKLQDKEGHIPAEATGHFVTCLYVTEDERLKLNCDQGLLIDNVHTSFCRVQ